MRAPRRILVVGGGIGGLCAAIALRRLGMDVHVIERRTADFVHGVGIIQPPNALRALSALGLSDACFANGFQSDERRAYEWKGGLLGQQTVRRLADPERGAVNFIKRPILHDILVEAAERAGARLETGVMVSALSQDDAGVNIVFNDGRQGRYDLVVGADGIRSQIRETIFDAGIAPQYTGHGVWRYTTHRPPEVTFSCLVYGIGVKAGLMPLSQDSMYLLLVTNEPGNPWMRQEDLPDLLRDRLRDFDGLIAPVRDSIRSDSYIVYAPIEEIILPGAWHSGRVVLMGDAAHASSPHLAQGAAMAIEDAVVLAEELAIERPFEASLSAYYERRAPRCRYVQENSHIAGDVGQLTDPVACEQRNASIRAAMASGRPSDDFLEAPI